MNHDMYIKIADQICNTIISLYKNKKLNNKNFLELYNELLDEKYMEYHSNILSYVPDHLAIKGYEIVSVNPFEIRKY